MRMARLFPARSSEALDKTPMSELTRAPGSSASHSKHGRQRLERRKRQDVPLLSGEGKAAHMAAVVACSAGAATPAAPSSDAERFILRSFTAALMASSASIEQWSLTGGRLRCLAISEFLMVTAWSMCWPLTHSVTTLELAMAEPQPKVLKHESTMLPSSSTRICSFMTSPHAGAPTRPVPTLASSLSKDPTLRGFSKWSTTFLW
mmetsp:Transcript_26890/g.43072  ORF Transcript_26890/g.43072 Transcript_26890/m.43072 type:complete len:205 (+) Transcript_26890:135-749(+)